MPSQMGAGRARKLILAAVAIGVFFAISYFGLEIPGLQPILMDLIMNGLTALGELN